VAISKTNLKNEFQSIASGFGPVLVRDYWTVIKNSRLRPHEIMDLVALKFPEFAPNSLCIFAPSQSNDGHDSEPQHRDIRMGDKLNIHIRMAAHCQVRVLGRDRASITLGTLKGHPEAGKITFGAYRNPHGDVIFHIRSRARSRNALTYLGFTTLGDPMQTNTWTEFVNRVALTVGDGPMRAIHADISVLRGEEAEKVTKEDDDESPTFTALGD
jgi:hypothetical protein